MRRRGLLTLGVVAAVVLVAGGGAVALLQPGWRDGHLSSRGRDVLAGAAGALLDGILPTDAPGAERAVQGLLARLEATIAAFPPHVQTELSQLLALLGSAGGRVALAGLGQDWLEAPIPQRAAALQAMRTSRLQLRQQAYQALHDLVGSAYFAEPDTWQFLGYPGPMRI